MKLTKREKILVTALLFFIAGYFLFQYIVTPQRAHLSVLQADLAAWEEKKQALDMIDDTMARYGQQQEDLKNQIQTVGNSYFSSLSQEDESIIVMNDLLRDSGLKDVALSFSPLAAAGLTDTKGASSSDLSSGPLVQKVQLSYEGSYDAMWKALGEFWDFEKCIQVDSITIAPDSSDSAQVTGEIDLSLYDLSQMTQVGTSMVEWSDNGQFRKSDPFQAVSGETFPGTRYVLDLGGDTTRIYVKFTDITGHWAETAIDDFGKQFIVTGDSENQFHPDDPITRGQFVVLLDNYYHWEAPENAVDLTQFADYAELGSSLSAMEKAFYKGYMLGYFVGFDDGTLRPNSPTSYKEFELVMGRIMNQPDFTWKAAALAIQQETGYTSPGLADDTASMTRAEAVYFLHSLPQT